MDAEIRVETVPMPDALQELYAACIVGEFLRRMAMPSDVRKLLNDFDEKYEATATLRLLYGDPIVDG